MKKNDNTTINDILTLGETALNVLLGARQEIASNLSGKSNAIASRFGLVTREEFDAAFAMIKKARRQQTALEERIKTIEGKMTLSTPQKPKKKKQIRHPK